MKLFKKIIKIFLLNSKIEFLPDSIYLKILYYVSTGNKLDLNHPKTFNEKLQFLKLNLRKNEMTIMVDKLQSRKYVEFKISENILIPLIDEWSSFEEIDFDKLPNEFVLKTNHDSGGVVICHDKSNINIEDIKNKLNKSLNRNYYWYGREWPYLNVKPKIFCEKLIKVDDETSLNDYKFMCFNGRVEYIFVCTERRKGIAKINILNRQWEDTGVTRANKERQLETPEKPKKLEDMIEYAETLSSDYPFIRVDFYEVENKIYFGELTFFPESGFSEFSTNSFDNEMGEKINLNRI